MIEFIGASMIDCSVHRRHYGLEIVSTKKHVSGWTGDFKEDRLSLFLREKSCPPVSASAAVLGTVFPRPG